MKEVFTVVRFQQNKKNSSKIKSGDVFASKLKKDKFLSSFASEDEAIKEIDYLLSLDSTKEYYIIKFYKFYKC